MHLVFDVIQADTMEFSVPSTPLSRGETHSSMEESLGALFNSIGFELIGYGMATRMRVNDQVLVRVTG